MSLLASECDEWGQIYPLLSRLAAVALVIPVSNVNCERDFSMMNRVRAKGMTGVAERWAKYLTHCTYRKLHTGLKESTKCVFQKHLLLPFLLTNCSYLNFQVKSDLQNRQQGEHLAACLRVSMGQALKSSILGELWNSFSPSLEKLGVQRWGAECVSSVSMSSCLSLSWLLVQHACAKVMDSKCKCSLFIILFDSLKIVHMIDVKFYIL